MNKKYKVVMFFYNYIERIIGVYDTIEEARLIYDKYKRNNKCTYINFHILVDETDSKTYRTE